MADLTADTVFETKPRYPGRDSFPIANGVTLYAGELVGVNSSGYLVKWADTTGHQFMGVVIAGGTGNTGVSPLPEARVDCSGVTIKNQPIAGTFVIADTGKLVYASTSNIADSTKSATTNVKAIGRATRFISAGRGDITLFTPFEQIGLN